MSDLPELHRRAGELLIETVEQVRDGHLHRATPCTEWNVTQVLQHAALDQGAWAAVISGTQPSGENPFAPSGELGAEPLAYADAALEASAPAWVAVSADAESVPTPLPSGPMAPADAAGAAALDAAIHAWDIAVAPSGSPVAGSVKSAAAYRPQARTALIRGVSFAIASSVSRR